MINTAYAQDKQMFIPLFGDEQFYAVAEFGDEEFMNYFFSEVTVPVSGGAAGGGRAKVGFYDVSVDVLEEIWGFPIKHVERKKVTARIILKNTGDVPDRDTTLIYYLQDINSTKFGETKEMLLEVPPMTYNLTACTQAGGIIEEATGYCITVLERVITLPPDSMLGQWAFYVEYRTVVQAPIKVYDSFSVVIQEGLPSWFSFLLFLLLMIALYRYLTKEDKEKKEKKDIYEFNQNI